MFSWEFSKISKNNFSREHLQAAASVNKKTATLMEPSNVVDKYAVNLKKEYVVVDHLRVKKMGMFAKIIFYFLHTDQ